MRFVVNFLLISSFVGINLKILLWSPFIITEAKSIDTSELYRILDTTVFKERHPKDLARFEPTLKYQYVDTGGNVKLPSHLQTGRDKSYQRNDTGRNTKYGLPNSFQEYLTNAIKRERENRKKGIPVQSHSRRKRNVIKKILIFIKILVKHFIFIAKKAFLAAG